MFFDDAHWLTLHILPKIDFFTKSMVSMAVSTHPTAMLAIFVFEITPKHIQFSSVIHPCSILCDHMDCSTPGFPVHHQLPKLIQIHVHRVGDDIQPSHASVVPFPSSLQSFPASGSLQMSQFFHQLAKVLEFQLQDQSFFSVLISLGFTGWIS